MKKIFITGICGFVGSSLASFYYKKNYHVSGIDNLSRKGSYKNFLKLKKKSIKIFKGNLCNNDFLNNFFKKKNKYNKHIMEACTNLEIRIQLNLHHDSQTQEFHDWSSY